MKLKLFAPISVAVFTMTIFSFTSCNCIKADGNVVTKTLDLKEFSKIELASSADVFVEYGETQKVEVKASANLIDNLKKEVKSGHWLIANKECENHSETMKIYVTVSSLDKFVLSGSGDVKIGSFSNQQNVEYVLTGSGTIHQTSTSGVKNASVSVPGSGTIIIDDMQCELLNVDIPGSGDVKINGSANKLSASISGSGGVDADGFEVSSCYVSISGSGNCGVNVSEELSVSISGSGNVKYTGSPSVKSNISGSGSVDPR